MDGSLIGRLPAELRNQIYHELVPEPTTMDIDLSQPKKRAESLPGQPQDALLALASTCKAIRREAMKIYYHGRVWHVNVNLFYASAGSIVVCPPTLRPRGFAELRSWLDDMGKDGMGNISDLHIFVKGKLGFLAWRDINRRNIESATNRLTDALRERRHGPDDYPSVPVHVGQPESALEAVDHDAERNKEIILARENDSRRNPLPAWGEPQRVMFPGELKRCLAWVEREALPTKWFIGKIAGVAGVQNGV